MTFNYYRQISFAGKHNRSKVKVWFYLLALKNSGIKGATRNQIHRATGVPISTLRIKMDVWWSWGRLKKQILPNRLSDGSLDIYSITAFGKKYLDFAVPQSVLNECIEEIEEHQGVQRQRQEELSRRVELIQQQQREALKDKPPDTAVPDTDEAKRELVSEAGGAAWMREDGRYHVVLQPFSKARHMVIDANGGPPENIKLFPGPREAYKHIIKNS